MNQKQKKLNWKAKLNEVEGKDAYEKTCIFGKLILQHLGATSPETAKSGQEAYEKLCQLMGKAEISLDGLSKNTFIQYLSKAASYPKTSILCEGRKQGYYVRDEENIMDDGDEAKSTRNQRGDEKLLYSVAARWLDNNSFGVATIAEKKKNGPWGNPDVVGVKVQEVCGVQDVEIVTIECKNSLDNWKRQIFEAVAHKRFADRVYFAFVLPVDEVEKKYGELIEYAEFFGVGLLVLEMEPEVLARYNKKASGIEDDLAVLEFREIYHAPRNHYLFPARKVFLEEVLDVTTSNALSRFGTNQSTVGAVPEQDYPKQPKNEKKKQLKDAGGTKGGKGRGRKVGK